MNQLPKLYTELADWWQVFSPTSDYADEGPFFTKLFKDAGAKTILELGAGGRNVAFYLKQHFKMTLTDLSPEMLTMSKKQNSECEHLVGDMRTLGLDKTFGGVFIHDAIMYITTAADLKAVFETPAIRLKPGGIINSRARLH